MLKLLLVTLCIGINAFIPHIRNPSNRISELNYKKKDLKKIDYKILLHKNKMKKLLQDRNLLFKNIRNHDKFISKDVKDSELEILFNLQYNKTKEIKIYIDSILHF